MNHRHLEEPIHHHDDEEDREHFQNVIAAFMLYRTYTLQRINKRSQYISTLPPAHQRRLNTYSDYLTKFRACVEVNESFLELVVRNGQNLFANVPAAPPRVPPPGYARGADAPEAHTNKAPSLQVDKVLTVLRQFVRDWSTAGALEREQCYDPIINEIRLQFPPDQIDVTSVSVLVPGAGLGRLGWEIARLGYNCEGNDVSMFMLIASNFILNHVRQKERHLLYPWLNHFNNNMSCEHQLVPVRVPDVSPVERHPDSFFNMVAGNFLEVYTTPVWSCVATCFFIDCAQNVIQFVENIFNILQPGGVWINLGPLLYHWSDMPEMDSIEPPYDILMEIIKDVGFNVEKELTGVKTKYTQNSNSMVQQEYDSVFFVCRKPTSPPAGSEAHCL